ncbi:MAG TPA: 30S ribosomal protein S16 [Gemmatimonas sp.]|nr:30S ribosomal protein S16 [Gemmatimonas sp.]
MAVKIRLRREGRKKTPMYRIVVADSQSPRDGRFIEIIGQYQPRFSGDTAINLQVDRVNYWLNVGAQPTDTVRSLLRRAGVLKLRHEQRLAAKGVVVGTKATAAAASGELAPPPGPVVMLQDDADRSEA